MLRILGWMVAIGLVLWVGAQAPSGSIRTLEAALAVSSTTARGWSVNAWTMLPNPVPTAQLHSIAQRLATTAHLQGAMRVTRGLDYDKAWVTQTVAGVTTEVIAERLPSGATYLVMDRAGNKGLYGLRSAAYLLPQWLRRMTATSPLHVATTLEAVKNGSPWTSAQRQAVVKRMLAAVDARPVSPLDSPHLISVAAFTPRIRQADHIGARPVNLQVAVTYNDVQHRNEVYVGTPLITVPY